MITSVMFDMGGTLEDIYVDERSEWAAIEKLDRMLREGGLDPQVDLAELKRRVDEGWKRYGAFRDSCDVELKPIPIWRDYALADFIFPREILEPLCEPIAHMWELTHYHRSLRPRVREMLEGDVTLSSVTGMRKPLPDIFEVSTRQLRVKPENCVYVGDTISRDIIGSKRAGFACAIQIGSKLTGEKDAGVRREFEPDYVIEDIYQVFPILRELMDKENQMFSLGAAGSA